MNKVLSQKEFCGKASVAPGHVHMVYVMGCDDNGPVKIGTSADVARRVMTLQTGSPMPLLVFALRLIMPKYLPHGTYVDWLKLARSQSAKIEKASHYKLRSMGLALMGEWFDVTADEATQVLHKVAESEGARALSPEWFSTEEALVDAELGWLRGQMQPSVLAGNAQARAVNEMGLTFSRKNGHI